MDRIDKVSVVDSPEKAILDLLQRIELIERSLKIYTLAEQQSFPIRAHLKEDLDVVDSAL